MLELQGFLMQDLCVRGNQTMITMEEAEAIIRTDVRTLGVERVPLANCLNRVLREDVVSDIDMPPFDKSAVDGYACRMNDINNPLTPIETIPAGIQPQKTVGPNECAKIMTGAVMPAGADCVLLREDVEEKEGTVHFKRNSTARNICFKGEDVVAGQKLVSSGTRITPSQIASLALAGYSQPLVCKRPGVGIVATGDEIVEPSEQPGQSKIRNSNSYQLIAHCEQFGCAVKYYGIAKDSSNFILAAIERAKKENDVLLLTGGVSAGDLDLVPELLEESGYKILIRQVGIQPGRPTVFGRSGDRYVFGIPGSPVASYIVFEVLVKELLAQLMGIRTFIRTARLPLACDVRRQKSNRIGWRPVLIGTDGKVHPVEYHGTAHISSYATADGIISLVIGQTDLQEGSLVDVRFF
jgi:molybdopterin molybdotransferase